MVYNDAGGGRETTITFGMALINLFFLSTHIIIRPIYRTNGFEWYFRPTCAAHESTSATLILLFCQLCFLQPRSFDTCARSMNVRIPGINSLSCANPRSMVCLRNLEIALYIFFQPNQLVSRIHKICIDYARAWQSPMLQLSVHTNYCEHYWRANFKYEPRRAIKRMFRAQCITS